jgi:PAS domain S-box-containing protein
MSVALTVPWVLLVLALAFGWWLRRRYERALRAHEKTERTLQATEGTLRRISQAVESASDAIGIGDMEGTSLYHNRAHIALFGYSVDELNAVPEPAVLFHDKIVASAIHAAIRGGYSWAGETEVRTKDGRVIPCFVRADVIRGEDGQPAGIFGVFTDITERRRSERQLDEQRQRLEVTLQSIGDAVVTTDTEGRIVLMNPIAEHFAGVKQAFAAGRLLREVLPLHDETTREPRESGMVVLLRERRRARATDTFLVIDSAGQERVLAESAALIRTGDGQVSGAVVALRDITRDRRRADEVARAGKLESLGMMAGSIAHDFGNLLTAIVANLQLAQLDPGLPATAKDRIDQAERAVWRARDVTQQLKTFAKGGTTEKKVIALEALLRESASFAVVNTAVQLRTQIASDLWPVEADESQLVQVINNLAVNAVQAMPHGGLLLVAAENFSPDEDSSSPLRDSRQVKITVSDTGSGIPPEHLAKIFEPFFTTKPKGTGLGLATSYSVIKKHGGELRVESAVGRGTTFQILLPAAEGATASASPFATAKAKKSLGRILLMDDDRTMRETLVLMLGLLDYEVTETEEGGAVLEKYSAARERGRPFDAVVLDLRVASGLGGAETVRRLREIDPAVRAIAVSGYLDDAVMTDHRAHGFDLAFAKPVKMDTLREALKKLLSAGA